jgi:anaerobic magnesium-protoporphyrin IX monomethyl ester cyclase
MLYAAARLRRDGLSVQLVDNRVEKLSLPALARSVALSRIVVVTTTPYDQVQNYFLDYRCSYAIVTIQHLKKAAPLRPIIVCGSHGTVRPDLVLRETGADVVVRGEYDTILSDVVRGLGNGRDGRTVANLVFPEDNNVCGASPPQPASVLTAGDLSHIMPAYDLVDLQQYFGDAYLDNQPQRLWGWGAVLASRGCRYSCDFCYNFWGNNVRLRDAESVADEVELLQTNHGVRRLFFIDFTFTQNWDWVLQLCREMRRRNLAVRWTAQTRCDLLSRDLLSEMAASGCERLWLGIESFSDSIVTCSRKYSSADFALEAVNLCKKARIEPHAFLMIGLPGETVDTLNLLFSRLQQLRIPYTRSIMVATPRFGTRYYDLAKAQYPDIGNDFLSLHAVRGLVANELRPVHIQQAVDIMRSRNFIYGAEPPRITG